jgi:sec-independent protein translocase protein TatA
MFRLGAPELLILLVIIVVLFGAGRIGRLAGEMGSGLRSFREALKEEKPVEEATKEN